ncbi:MAG TPA: sigma-70 family RNA polymerase sigma factor [Thermoguttaceae bacterium]|nr:sigma-70 family RNA polymerase sigma factor [Thermoguttaceae bacterium]
MAAERKERPTTSAGDRELLRRFARSSDEAAFEEIVRRHGALVLGVCRRVLGNGHDVEDAFQATFLVLATSARKIRRRASLASWLHGVAYRIALKHAKKKYAAREEPLGEVVANEENPFDQLVRRHDEHAVDEELHALGEKYRRPLVLHYLEGRTNRDIAGELGLSLSAVEGRLKRAKAQLRRRLLRRGITLSTLGAVAWASQEAAGAEVSASLIASTVESSVSYAAGNPCGSTLSHQLAQSEVLAMASTARNIGALAALSAVVACVGIWSAATFGAGQKAGAGGAALAATADGAGEKQPAPSAVVTIGESSTGQPAYTYGSSGPRAEWGGTRGDSPRYYYTYSGPSTSSTSRHRKAVEQIGAALDKDFEAAPLQATSSVEQFAQVLREQLGVPVVVDRRALADVGIAIDTEIEVDLPEKGLAARSVLRLVFDQYDLEYVITDEVLLITTPEEAENRLETLVYSTRELRIPAEELSQIITQTVAPESWDGVGGPGTVRVLPEESSGLVVSQTQRVHERIADLLEQLRRNTGAAAPTATAGTTAEGGYHGAFSFDGRRGMIEKRPAAPRTPGRRAVSVERAGAAPAAASTFPTRIPAGGTSVPPAPAAPVLRIDFRHQPWKDVLEWFASTQSLTLVMDAVPPAVLNYSDPEPKSAQQVMELFNSVLLTQGYALVTQGKTLRVVQIQRPESGEAPKTEAATGLDAEAEAPTALGPSR